MSERILQSPPPSPDHILAYGEGHSRMGDLRLPAGPGPHPVAMLLHGGFWRVRYDRGHLGHLCAALTAVGFATWNVEYRRVGETGGGWPGTLEDVVAARGHLRTLALTYPLDLSRVLVAGHSAGGHLALWLASRRAPAGAGQAAPIPIQGVLALAAVSDLYAAHRLHLGNGAVAAFLGGSPEDLPQRYRDASPLALLPFTMPIVAIHGTDDEDVPFALSETFVEAARAHEMQARLIALPGMGHFEPIDPLSDAGVLVVEAALGLLGPHQGSRL